MNKKQTTDTGWLLPSRGTGLRTGRAGARRKGHPRTDKERAKRHLKFIKKGI